MDAYVVLMRRDDHHRDFSPYYWIYREVMLDSKTPRAGAISIDNAWVGDDPPLEIRLTVEPLVSTPETIAEHTRIDAEYRAMRGRVLDFAPKAAKGTTPQKASRQARRGA